MKIGSLADIIHVIILGMMILAVLSGFLLFTFLEQETIIKEDAECSKIEKCIILEIECLDVNVKNSLLWFEWELDTKSTIKELRKEYEERCVEDLF